MKNYLRIEVRDSLLDPDLLPNAPKEAYWFKGDDGKARYKVWIYLVGDDLPYVESVTYKLHPTFADPVRKVMRALSNPNCELVTWMWGIFDLGVEITDKFGNVYEVTHGLTYGRQIEQGGITFIEKEAPTYARRPQLKRSRYS